MKIIHIKVSIHSLCTTPIFGYFLPLFFLVPLKLHQVAWVVSVHSHFQLDSSLGSG